jgi:hypothetical protein
MPFHRVVTIRIKYLLSLLQLLLYVTGECLTLLPFVQEDSKFDSLPGTVCSIN